MFQQSGLYLSDYKINLTIMYLNVTKLRQNKATIPTVNRSKLVFICPNSLHCITT